MNELPLAPDPVSVLSADILIVDDTPDNLRLLSALLSENGYKVRKAINGERALQAIQAVPPDLVLLDINMPGMNGYEVCRRLKAAEQTREMPVIFISAMDAVFDKVAAFEAGGVDYITKPFQVQEVLARVESHVNLSRLRRQLQTRNAQLQQEVQQRLTAENALKTLNQQLETRVQERTAELQTANEQLRTLEAELRRQLNLFLHAVSHDLRNPVLGTAMVLNNLSNQSGDEIHLPRAILQRMTESNQRQLNLINSLIDTHAAEIWGIAVHPRSVALRQLVQSALDDLQPMLDKEHTVVNNQIASSLPPVHGDPLQLVRVYENLVANALKHNPPGLSLVFDARLEEGWIHCSVADNGVGIGQQQLERLFDPYFRGAQKPKSVGLGLGLYLCQQIIQAHGGVIGVQSQPGQGTTFWFTLPLSHPGDPSGDEQF